MSDKVNLQDNPDNEARVAALRRERLGVKGRAESEVNDHARDNAKRDLAAIDKELGERGFKGDLSDPDDAGGPATAPNTKMGRLSTGPDPRVGDPTIDVGAAANVAAAEYEDTVAAINTDNLAGGPDGSAAQLAKESAGKAKAARVAAGEHGDDDGPAPEGYVKQDNAKAVEGAKPKDLPPAQAKDDEKAKAKGEYPAPQGRSAKPGNTGNTAKG